MYIIYIHYRHSGIMCKSGIPSPKSTCLLQMQILDNPKHVKKKENN